MKLNKYIGLVAVALPLASIGQTVVSFEEENFKSIGVYDTWEESPFRTGKLQGNVAVVDNHLNAVDSILGSAPNATAKILAMQRSRFASNTFGARIDLKETFELTKDYKYVHVLIHKPTDGRVMLVGLGKRTERAGQSPEAEQFWVLSSSKVVAGNWCDAVFPVKGAGGIDIHSLVVVPDCESPHALSEDFAVFIDEIVVNNDPAPRFMRGEYLVNVEEEQGYTRNDRHLDGVTLQSADGVQKYEIAAPRKVYTKALNRVFLAKAGEKVVPSFQYTGNWMNGYVYLDRNQDGKFAAELGEGSKIPAGSDIMTFSNLEGVNSNGDKLSSANVLNPPSFQVPSDLPNGIYRMRYKVDWSSVDPAGRVGQSNSMLQNGGAICDVLLNVHGDYCNVNDANRNGEVLSASGEKLVKYKAPFGKPFTIKMHPENGFTYDGIRLRHGYNLAGDSLVHGNPQYRDVVFPAYLFRNDELTIPAECMDGDVEIEGLFIEMKGDSVRPDEDYALNFDPELKRNSRERTLSNVVFKATAGGTTTLTVPAKTETVYADMMQKAVSVVPGDEVAMKAAFKGSGLHYYLYVDLNQNGYFQPVVLGDGKPSMSGELLSYTYYKGYNSKGEKLDNADEVAMDVLPSFRIPESMPTGNYRARLKVDYDNIDPAGQWEKNGLQQIDENGGYVIDFLLNVHDKKHPLHLMTSNGNLYAPNNGALPMEIAPYTALSVVAAPAVPGYVAEGMTVKHGHHFDGPQYIHGNRQWSEYTVKAGAYTLPKDSVTGDVQLTVHYTKGEDAEYDLVFSDEFNAPDRMQPDIKKWSRCKRQSSTWNRWLSDSEEVVYLENGNLMTRAIPNPDTKKDPVPMITGGVQSQKKFAFTYGKLECRAKANPWVGTFPAIWLMPEDQSDGWPTCGEVDIFECIDKGQTAYHTVHSHWTYDLGNKSNPRSSFTTQVPLDRYHTYGLEWDAQRLRWFVDGKLVGTYTKSSDPNAIKEKQWPFDKNFYIILNQSVGNGSWASNPDLNHTYEFAVDWVRVYQKSGMENTDGIVGLIDVHEDAGLSVEVVPNGIKLYADYPVDVRICDLQGRLLYAHRLEGSQQVNFSAGVYLVNGRKVFVR